MRTITHWTPRYIKNRMLEFFYYKSNPDHPWLTKSANQILATYLMDSDIGLEFGSGRSTLWLAKRIQHLTSIEHNKIWYQKVNHMLKEKKQFNVDYHLILRDELTVNTDDYAYVRLADKFGTNSLDFVLIDGIYRDFCALHVIEKIRPGGLMIIDNINRYLPSTSNAPNSRSFSQGPKNSTWSEVHKSVENWRMIWTSSGVTDTAFFFKPCK